MTTPANPSRWARDPGALMLILLGWVVAAMAAFPVNLGATTSEASLVTLEVRYELPAAGEVIFVWGVNGWLPVAEDLRPPGTVIRNEVMRTPMVLKDNSFVVTLQVERGATVDYQFLITKTAGEARVTVWDSHETYRATATKSAVLIVKSVRLSQGPWVLRDRAGSIFAVALAVIGAGLLLTAIWLIWSHPRPTAANNQPVTTDPRFALVVSVLALILGLVVILHHEMWRDELQAWRIATGSHTLSELLHNAQYEGHPPLWYLCLYILSRFSNDPLLMQLFHLGMGVAAIFLVSHYAPFTRWQKAYLAFGYFSFYEYLIVSRNYVLGVLALVAFCVVRTQWPKRMLTAAALLAIMSNTSALGAIIALALGGWLLLESFRRRDTVSLAPCLGVVFVLGVGLVVAVILTSPPPDSLPRMLAWNTSLLGAELEKTVSAIWRAYMPVPVKLPHFWNTNLLDELPPIHLGGLILEPLDVQAILSVGFLGIAALMLVRTPSIMLFYVVATGGLLLFMHLKVNAGIRHMGHVFLVLVVCLWFSLSEQPFQITRSRRRGAAGVVTSLFATHMVAAALAASTDLIYPFSASRQTAEFIERRGLIDSTMVGSKFDIASAVANYLNHPVYYVEQKQIGTFVRWKERRTRVTPAEVVRTAHELASMNHTDIVMIVSYDLGADGVGIMELASFQQSILKEERYWLYLVPYRTTRSLS